jgi:uncharacterized protein
MSLALLFSALMLGLASGGHCIAMCGAGTAWCLGSGASRSTRALSLLSFHSGRVSGYALMGALLGGAAEMFQLLSTWINALRPLWTMANAALFIVGLSLLLTARQPAFVIAAGQGIGRWMRRLQASVRGEARVAPLHFVPANVAAGSAPPEAAALSPRRGLLLGLGWALIPCGPLYSAWTLSLFAGSPLNGAAIALAFAIPSGLQLAFGQWWFARYAQRPGSKEGGRWDRLGTRAAGAALCVSAAYAIAMLAFGHPEQGVFCL